MVDGSTIVGKLLVQGVTELAQKFEAEDAGVMTVRPLKLQGVLADEFDSTELEIVWNVHRKQDARTGHFISARRAGALTPQHRSRKMGFVAVGPNDHQLAGVDLLDLRWCRDPRIRS